MDDLKVMNNVKAMVHLEKKKKKRGGLGICEDPLHLFGDLDSSTIINGILFFSLSLFSQDKIVPRTISGSRTFFSRLWYMKFRMHFEYYTWFAVSRVVPDETFSATHPNKMQKFRDFKKQVYGIYFSWNQRGHKQVFPRLIMNWDFFRETEVVTKNRCVLTIFWKLLQKKRQKFRGKIRIMHFKTLWAEK